jgi:hypothetical protein
MNVVSSESTRPGHRTATSWNSQPLPSGSLNAQIQRVQGLLDERLCVVTQRIVGSANNPIRTGEHDHRDTAIDTTCGSATRDPEQLGGLDGGFAEFPRVASRRALGVAEHGANAPVLAEDQGELEASDVLFGVVEPRAR